MKTITNKSVILHKLLIISFFSILLTATYVSATESIICSKNTDCGTNGMTDGPICQNGNVFQNWVTKTCINPGTTNSKCSASTELILKTDCSIGNTISKSTQYFSNSDIYLTDTRPPQIYDCSCSGHSYCDAGGYHPDDLTATKLCLLKGYDGFTTYTIQYNFYTSPGDNYMTQWNGATFNNFCSTLDNRGIDTITCYKNTVVPGTCSNGQCTPVACSKDTDCDDSDPKTIDKCLNPGQQSSTCSHNKIKCNTDTDCGFDSFINDPFCMSNNVFQDFISYTCKYPGTKDSSCSTSTASKLKSECSSSQKCSSGKCENPICKKNSDCGNDHFGDNYCKDDGVYHDQHVFSCTDESKCKETINPVKVESCSDGCTNGKCINHCVDNDHDGYDTCNPGEPGDDGNPIDCDDHNCNIHPDAMEICNGIDDNCNGRVDEGCGGDSIPPAVDLLSPVNNQIFTGSVPKNIDFIFNVIEESNIKSCQVNVNGHIYQNITTISKMHNNTITVSLNTGNYSGFVSCFDQYNNKGDSQVVNFKVNQHNENCDPNELGTVTNLKVKNKGSNYITWQWTNPKDNDFLNNIIFIDGDNVANVTTNSYKATDLDSDTSYKITIHTQDRCGNINSNDVTNIGKTNKESSGGSSVITYPYPEPVIYEDTTVFGSNTYDSYNESLIVTIKPSTKYKTIFNWSSLMFWILVAIFILLLIIIIVLIIRNSEANNSRRR